MLPLRAFGIEFVVHVSSFSRNAVFAWVVTRDHRVTVKC